MKNNIQISLFLDENTYYKPNALAYELNKEIENLGEPTLLPENTNFPQEANAPIVLFIKNDNLKFLSNFYRITVLFQEEEIDRVMEHMKKIMKVLKELNILAYRIGYVVTLEYENEKILELYNRGLINEEIAKSEDFELSWLNSININKLNVNCWKRYYTERNLNNKLNVLYDINTKPEEKNNIDIKFILRFIEDAEKYIKQNDK